MTESEEKRLNDARADVTAAARHLLEAFDRRGWTRDAGPVGDGWTGIGVYLDALRANLEREAEIKARVAPHGDEGAKMECGCPVPRCRHCDRAMVNTVQHLDGGEEWLCIGCLWRVVIGTCTHALLKRAEKPRRDLCGAVFARQGSNAPRSCVLSRGHEGSHMENA